MPITHSIFRTEDLDLASYIALVCATEPEFVWNESRTRCTFQFTNDAFVERCARQFQERKATVEPKAFYEKASDLKVGLHRSRGRQR
jgi:hypothetical protein